MNCACDNIKTKRAGADLDYLFDFAPKTNERTCGVTDYLEPGEKIDTFSVTVTPSDLVQSLPASLEEDATAVKVWLDAGTVGVRYEITCEITTTFGRTELRTLYLTVI